MGLTAILLNWKRPDNVRRIVQEYERYAAITRIVVFNNGARLDGLRSSKLVLVEASSNMGLYPRFAMAGLAQTEAIFHTDDDLLVPEGTLLTLYDHWTRAPFTCQGVQGRRADERGYNGENVWGEVEVVLTRALVSHRITNLRALELTPRFADLACVPMGNGEDILLSFVASSLSGRKNMAHKLPFQELPDKGRSVAISVCWPDHYKHRSAVVRRCLRVVHNGGTARSPASAH